MLVVGLLVLSNGTYGNSLVRSPSSEGARVYFISPIHGDTVVTPFTVRFGLTNMGVSPAGLPYPWSGHHHLIINTETPDLKLPIPANEHHLHFGAGQTEVTLDLLPGSHTLQLILGDKDHIPHDPPLVSQPITVRVKSE